MIVTLMKQKFVDELHWIDEDEMLDLVAIAQSAPGAIAVNGAIVVGYQIQHFILIYPVKLIHKQMCIRDRVIPSSAALQLRNQCLIFHSSRLHGCRLFCMLQRHYIITETIIGNSTQIIPLCILLLHSGKYV